MVPCSNALGHIVRSVDGNEPVANDFVELSIVLQLFNECVKLVELFLVDRPGAGLDGARALKKSVVTTKGRCIISVSIVVNK